jgi:mRNA interferase MazF
MPVNFNPVAGTILVCDYKGNIPPEMDKVRPVVVVSPAFKNRYKLATVVALSTSPPTPIQAYHFEFTLDPPLPPPFDSPTMWVKGDMLFTASYDRLDRFRLGKNSAGIRTYGIRQVPNGILPEIHKAVLNGLGLGRLTPHL